MLEAQVYAIPCTASNIVPSRLRTYVLRMIYMALTITPAIDIQQYSLDSW